MRVGSLELQNFTLYEKARLDLPEEGVVLLEGPNGAGKSSLLEAISWAVHGKTLRGTDPSSDGRECVVSLALSSALTVKRVRENGTTKVQWESGKDSIKYESKTKSEEALRRQFMPFEVWRRACVFSSSEASSFTMATDTERKRLLEQLFGLAAFDEAEALCREELRVARNEHTLAREHAQEATVRLGEVSLNLDRLQEETAKVRASGRLDEQTILARILELEGEVLSLPVVNRRDKPTMALFSEAEGHEARAAALAKRLDAVRGGSCMACGQPVPRDLARAMKAELEMEQAAAREMARTATETFDARSKVEARTSARRRALEAEMGKLDRDLAAYRGVLAASAQLGGLTTQARARRVDCMDALATAAAAADKREAFARRLEACIKVLCVRGVRARILAQALGGLEVLANSWLAKLCPEREMSLVLGDTTERKNGAISDTISLEVVGAGGGKGYRAASGGERRRIDLALTFALSEAAMAANPVLAEGSTLFLDEMADGLDGMGKQAAAKVIREQAVGRCVVVISHSAELAEALEPDLQYHVENGKIERR